MALYNGFHMVWRHWCRELSNGLVYFNLGARALTVTLAYKPWRVLELYLGRVRWTYL